MNEKLNKKLAEWAGFYCLEGIWTIYDEDVVELTLPDFTNSLDACLKWLVPKLGIWEMWNWEAHGESGYGFGVWKKGKKVAEHITKYQTPALALCLAIEKLIEGEK